jgi:hypothetical protein
MNKEHRFILLWGIAILGIAFYFYYGIYKNLFIYSHLIGGDFKHGYDTALRYLSNQPIYFGLNDHRTPFLYTPLALILFLPFCWFTSDQAILLWFIICHAMVLISAWLVYRMGCRINKRISVFVTIATFCFSTPLYVALYYGNINILILLAFCLLYYLTLHGRKRIVPAILAACTYLKIFPALYMIIFLKSKNWKLISFFVLYLFLFGILSLFIFGFEININYIKNVIPSGMKWSGIVPGMSLSFFIKLFPCKNSGIYIFIINTLFGILLLTVWWFQRVKIANDNLSCALSTDLLVLPVIAMIIFPASWLQYHLYFIVTFYFIIFLKWHYNITFKWFSLFVFLFIVINLWQFILYHFPLTKEGVSMIDLLDKRIYYPTLYSLSYSLPFIFNILLYVWLIRNYRILFRAMKDLSLKLGVANIKI